MKMVTIVYGTRPEAIKIAPVARLLSGEPDFDVRLVSTGQHRDMLHPVEELFELRPDVRFETMRKGQRLGELFGRVTTALDAELEENRPDVLIVHGDTSTAAAAALAGFHHQVPVAHLEAGLRSGDLSQPFPEEGNRVLISRITGLHLAPTTSSRENLRREGVPDSQIVVTGNTVIDAMKWASASAEAHPWPHGLEALNEPGRGRKLVLVTLHRRENIDSGIGKIADGLATLLRRHPELVLVLPLHGNPIVRQAVTEHLEGVPNALLVEPVDYLTMTKLLAESWLVITDSGGIQEEAPAFGVPVLVARETTERPEAIDAGVAELIGSDATRLVTRVEQFLADETAWSAMATAVSPFGDGRSAARVQRSALIH